CVAGERAGHGRAMRDRERIPSAAPGGDGRAPCGDVARATMPEEADRPVRGLSRLC
ncbi:MAG: hypothetical protein AVDCRST_MAG49-1024, partial [uncultured Thermomicrobiales bacterium]